ncbi:MAG TPA: poly-gamma-glutamate hydrolase family protein [Candidatus Nanopelagicales bacterium]|nr:poly-gamma-glutamate hydrolase family protein [Candidatus Nanopelagicales bacterium]
MRRVKLGLISMALGAGAVGCGAEVMEAGGADVEEVGSAELAIEYTSLTFAVDNTLANEHCALPQAKRDVIGVGRQIRIKNPSAGGVVSGGVALCTVDQNASGDDAKVLVNQTTMERRFGLSTSSTSTMFTGVDITSQYDTGAPEGSIARPQTGSAPDLSFTASDIQEWVTPASSGLQAGTHRVIYTVPHGIIEFGTDTQVQNEIVDSLASWDAVWMSLLRFSSTSSGPGFLHITSEDISEHSFHLLQPMMNHGFDYAVSFHGCSSQCPNDDVVVGGDIEEMFRKGVAELLHLALEDFDIPVSGSTRTPIVTAVTAGGSYPSALAGQHDNNYVNRLAEGGRGLQIEQSSVLRAHTGTPSAADTVASTVKSVFDCLLDTPDAVKQVTASGQDVRTWTNYASLVAANPSGGVCQRYIAEYTSDVDVFDIEGIGVCHVGGTKHTDIYRERSDGTWQRIGGGIMRGSGPWSSYLPCVWGQFLGDPAYEWPSTDDMAAGKFRIVVGVTDASGAIVGAGVRVQS